MFDETNIFALLKDKYVLPKKVKLFESFAGIGCQRMAFNRLGIEVEMVGISEIDKYAIQSYMAIHGETKNFGDITKINGNDLPQIDVFTYSFPCTDLSKAGKQKGLDETRSGLVYEVLRILHELDNVDRLPKVLIMENVVDLIQVKFIKQFQEIQLELEQLGYSNYTETMNAKDYGVAQNRDRVFMVSILGDYYYEFPKPFKLEKRLKDYLEYRVEEKYYLTETSIAGLNQALERHGQDIDKITDNGKELNVIQYPRGENHGGLISDITSPTVDGAIGARNTALLCVKEKVYQGVVDEKYYLSEKAISGLNRADTREHTPTWLNDESSESPCIDTRVGALTHWSPYVKENERYIQWDNTGKGHNSQDCRAYRTDGNICTISASNANGDKTQIIEQHIIVKENNSTGYDVAIEGDCININQPNSKTRMGRVGHQVSQTLTTQQELVVVEPKLRIRKLTPLECWRLMGIDDSDFNKASQVCSNSQLYKQAGNGIVVDVFAAILKQMKGD